MKFNDYPAVYGFIAPRIPSVKDAGFEQFYDALIHAGPDAATRD